MRPRPSQVWLSSLLMGREQKTSLGKLDPSVIWALWKQFSWGSHFAGFQTSGLNSPL